MNYYLDITLLPDAEANLAFIWQKVYLQIHLALADNSIADDKSAIAISMPEYGKKGFPLGNKLRLFAETKEQLQQLDVSKWLKRLIDYSHCTSIKAVPASVQQFAYFIRKQANSNVERLVKRRMKRKKESLVQALSHFEGYQEEDLKLPFVYMKSLSKNIIFPLFVEIEIVEKSQSGDFTCYGLSRREKDKQATVPWF